MKHLIQNAKKRLSSSAIDQLAVRFHWAKGMIDCRGYSGRLPQVHHPDPLITIDVETGVVAIGYWRHGWEDSPKDGEMLNPQPTHWAFIPGILCQ